MGAMFRSERMSLVQLLLQPEAAYQSMIEVGKRGVAQFRELNGDVNMFQRKFTTEIRRCEEMERKISYFRRMIAKETIAVPDLPESEVMYVPTYRELLDLESQLERSEKELVELSENHRSLLENRGGLIELRYVLENAKEFFSNSDNLLALESTTASDGNEDKQLGFVAGVIARQRIAGFERMLWRVSRGNIFLRQATIEEPLFDPNSHDTINKHMFVAFFQGEQLKACVKKVCSGYHASLYNCPSDHQEQEEMLSGVRTRIEDLNMVLNRTHDQRQRVLLSVAQVIQPWETSVKKVKAIYCTLNKFNVDVSQKYLLGEAWVPTDALLEMKAALQEGSTAVGSTVPSFLHVLETNENPPTYTKTNKFTRGFQNLIEAYGVASYREVNPALYTIITFPFLFAVMFGDLGHGFLLTLVGLWMVLWEKKLSTNKDEIWQLFFGGRYIILLMGLFSMYTGFIYNDVFSKPINLFGSAWSINYNTSTIMDNKELQLNPSEDYSETVYWYGLDPLWMLATNKIIFLNSFKMKLSIIFGVAHMMFGVCMSLVNHCHFRKPMNFLLEFLPQMLFLIMLFAYMSFMMIFKWIHYTGVTDEDHLKPGCAPSVLIMFINMMLFKSEEPLEGCREFMFEGQDIMQIVFVVVALACIPWLLFAKPVYIWYKRRNRGSADITGNGDSHDQEPMSEILILQAIHTIEYILSTISHTASYLRLWALSLAHAQLSEVLYSRVFKMAFYFNGYIGSILVYFVFWPWSSLTLVILVGMEGLSAFLHTLRLHWVEFMSKFYQGLGYPFKPFSFKALLEEQEME